MSADLKGKIRRRYSARKARFGKGQYFAGRSMLTELALTRTFTLGILSAHSARKPRPKRPDMEVRPPSTTEGRALAPERSVLVVDRSEETREVLKTALERSGMRIFAAGGKKRGLELARRHQPDLIVLDLELDESTPEEILASFAQQSRITQSRMVLLGGLNRKRGGLSEGEFVSKPYHYGPLVRRIEELLGATGQALARSA